MTSTTPQRLEPNSGGDREGSGQSPWADVCVEADGVQGRKEGKKKGRKEKVAMEMAGEIALQMDGWIDGNTRKHWGGVSGPHRSPAIVPVTSSHPDKRSLKHVWFL